MNSSKGAVNVRPAEKSDEESLIRLIAGFRAELARLRGVERPPDPVAAREELAEYLAKGFPIYVAEVGGEQVGHLVCRVDGDVVWAEQLYVLPGYRRRGIGTALYEQAEKLVQKLGSDTVYNWVHPNNDAIIAFLKKRGYTVLNLIELRRPRPGERPRGQVRVEKHEFSY